MSYLEKKEDVFACMNNGLKNNHNSIDAAYGYTTFETIDTAEDIEDITDIYLIKTFIAIFMFEVEHKNVENLCEEQATYWIYQYLTNPEYRKQLPDPEELDKDIEYIRSHHNVQFKRLKCYDEQSGIE